MVISKAMHKAFLASLFYDGSSGLTRERRFPMSTIAAAARCFGALKVGSDEKLEDGARQIRFVDGDVTFNDEEATLLRDLVNSLTEATPSEFKTITEIRAIFEAAPADQPTGDNVVSIV